MTDAVQSPSEPTAESRHRMLLEHAPVGILNSDPEHRCIEANESICRMLGYSREELIGMHAAEFVVPADVERQGEWRLRRKDATTFQAMISATRLPDGTLLEMIQDVTALQEREEARRIAEQRLRSEMRFSESMLESMPGIVYIYDSHRRFKRWNRNFEAVSGYSAAEIAGMHPLDFFAGEDKALVERRIAEVFEHGESSVEALFVARDGTTRPYFFTGRLAQFDSGPCLIGMGIDTFERRRALDRLAQLEREYRELVAAANSIILRWDPAGRITYINDFGQQFFGYGPELVGRHVMDTIVPRTESGGRDLARLMDDICAEPASFSQNVNENMRRDGARVWIAWTNRIVRDAAGRVIELLSIGTDITEQKRAQQLLRESEERARQAQKLEAIGLLASGVAHDFNNLLATILGNTQLALADTADSHPARESLNEISNASLRARSLVQQILSFARHQPQQRRVIELAPNLQEAHNFLRAILPAAVDLVFSLDAATPLVLADATQVYQLIANLCTNAWHAFEGRPGRIEVRLRSVTLDAAAASSHPGLKPGRFACLSVTDNGKGMDDTVRERIFDPFYTTREPGTGIGLGMSVVHGIVQSHEGAITVDSRPGVGTTVEVYFPATAGEIAPQVPATAPERGNGQHILYLDDEGPLVFLATRMLHRLGYRVSGYTRAENALQDYRENPAQFDLAITDLNMPTLSGIEVAAELLRLRPDLPVVLCSGHVTEELVQRARRAGICEVLYKPGTIEEFAASIHRIATGVTAGRSG